MDIQVDQLWECGDFRAVVLEVKNDSVKVRYNKRNFAGDVTAWYYVDDLLYRWQFLGNAKVFEVAGHKCVEFVVDEKVGV